MRMLINTSPLLDPLTGVGNYIRNLILYFDLLRPQNTYTYYYGLFGKRAPLGNKQIYRIKRLIKKIPFLPYALRSSRDWLSSLQHENFDIYFEPNFIPLNIKAKKIITTVHDFSFHLHPEWHPKDRIDFFSKHFYKNISRSDRIITDSSYIKAESVDILKLSNCTVTSIHLGIDHGAFKVHCKSVLEDFRTKMSLPADFILYIGNIEPRKNLKGLLQAYSDLPQSLRKQFKLVLVGFEGGNGSEAMKILKGLKDEAIYLGYVDGRELPYFYNLATLFVFPTLYEGFGLPPLEAMACGCPVVASNVASLPEVCGDAAYYVNPYDTDSIAEGMYEVLSDDSLRQSLIEKGLERAKMFSWEKCAREHIKVFEEVLNS